MRRHKNKAQNADPAKEVLRYLKRIDPAHSSKALLKKILSIFFSVNVDLFHSIVDWLSTHFGDNRARAMVATSLRQVECPFVFEVLPSAGMAILVDSVDDEARGHMDTICIDQNTNHGSIVASVIVGDCVHFNGNSKSWWTVVDFKIDEGTVLLSRIFDHSKGAASEAKKRVEYKELHSISFLNGVIERTVSQPTNESILQPWFKEGVSPEYPLTLTFKIPGPDPSQAVHQMVALVQQYHRERNLLGVGGAGTDPIKQMQAHTQVRVWLGQKEDVSKARNLLLQINPFCSVNRQQWLLVARALKTVSRGGSELLPDFLAWSDGAGGECAKRTEEGKKAWDAMRPETSCDHECVARARVYLRAKGFERDGLVVDETGRLVHYFTRADPLVTSVLDSVSGLLAERLLVFLTHQLDEVGHARDDDAGGTDSGCVIVAPPRLAVVVPAAVYEYTIESKQRSSKGVGDEEDEGFLYEHPPMRGELGRFVSTEELPAHIGPGDVINLKAALLNSGPAAAAATSSVRVLSVDLLFARLRVVPCPPPPACWLVHETTQSFWLPVSALWAVSVCRLQAPRGPSEQHILGYWIFATPLPSSSRALAVLASLSEAYAMPDHHSPSLRGPWTSHKIDTSHTNTPTAAHAQSGPLRGTRAATKANTSSISGEVTKKKGLKISVVQVFADAAIVQWAVDRDTALQHLLHRLQCPKAKLVQALVPDASRSDMNSRPVAGSKGGASGGGHGDLDGRLEVSLELETLASEAACASAPTHDHHPRHHRHHDGDDHHHGHDDAATALLGEQARWGECASKSDGPPANANANANAKKRPSSAPPKRSSERIPRTVPARGASKAKSEAAKVEGHPQATAPQGWKEVYRGSGSACQISALPQLTRHALRVRLWLCNTRSPSPSRSRSDNVDAQPSSSSQALLVATDHCHFTTLGGPPLHAPTLVGRWERAETYLRMRDNDQSPAQQQIVRGVIAVSLPADYQPRGGGNSSYQLPVGCTHVLEFAVATKGDRREDPLVGASSSTQWRQLAHGASGMMKVVGPWEGVCLLLRSYVVNQEGVVGSPSSVAIMAVPLMLTSNKGDRHVHDFVSTMRQQQEPPP